MKISQIKKVAMAGGSYSVSESSSVDFSSLHDGSFKALVPLTLPNAGSGDNRSFTTAVPVVIASETSRNAKGRQRLMMKVTLPYQALNPDVENTSVVANLFDSSRTGGEITAHIVISVAKPAAEDLRGVRGSTIQRCAGAQIMAVLKTLVLMCGPEAVSFGNAELNSTGVVGPLFKLPGLADGSTVTNLDNGSPVLTDTVSQESGQPLEIGPVQGFGATGFNLSGLVDLGSLLKSPIVRGLNGLDPIEEGREFQTPVVLVKGKN